MSATPILLVNRAGFREASVPAQPVDGTGTLNLVATLDVSGGSIATLTGIVGAAAPLVGLKISCAAIQGGTHQDRFVNEDFNQWQSKALPYSGRSDLVRSVPRSSGAQPTSNPNYATLSPTEASGWDNRVIAQNIHQTPANGTFQITVDLSGIAELKVWAASSGVGTTLALEIGLTKAK